MKYNDTKKNTPKERPIVLITVVCFIICLAVLTGLCYAAFRPNINSDVPFDGTVPGWFENSDVTSSVPSVPSGNTDQTVYTRKEGYYTFLVCGMDDVSKNTDVMMLVSLDTVNDEINILQIPRDTFVNPDTWGTLLGRQPRAEKFLPGFCRKILYIFYRKYGVYLI